MEEVTKNYEISVSLWSAVCVVIVSACLFVRSYVCVFACVFLCARVSTSVRLCLKSFVLSWQTFVRLLDPYSGGFRLCKPVKSKQNDKTLKPAERSWQTYDEQIRQACVNNGVVIRKANKTDVLQCKQNQKQNRLQRNKTLVNLM